MKFLLVAIVSILLAACSGYKPVPEYSNEIFDVPVLTKVKIDPEDPDIGVYLQDEISKMAVNRLNLTLTKNVDEAKGYILVNSYTINTTPVNKDNNGSVIRYSVNAAIEFAIKDKYGFWSKNIVSNEYVSVKAQSLISALEKENASKLAIQKALDTFILAVLKRTRDVATKEPQQDTSLVKKEKDSYQESTQTDMSNYDTYDTMQDETQNTQESTTEVSTEQESNTQVDENSNNSSEDLKIIPVDEGTNLVEDATEYN